MTLLFSQTNPWKRTQESVTPRQSPQEAQRKLMKYEGSYTHIVMITGCSSDFLLNPLLAVLSLWWSDRE